MDVVGRPRVTADELIHRARQLIDRLGPTEVPTWVQRGAAIVDLCCQDERRSSGTIPGSIHIPRSVLEWRADPSCEDRDARIANLDQPLVFLCADG